MPTVVVPFRGGCPYRERAWEWVSARYRERHPDWKIRVGIGGEPWIKADAVMPEIRNADDDVVIVADADVWTDGLESAVRAVTAGVAEWATPFRTVYRLAEGATETFMAQGWDKGLELDRRPYEGVWGGGIVVSYRNTLLDVPLDSRFVGYGQEDEAWGLALCSLKGGGWRGGANLYHLYHPPQPRLSDRRGSVESWALYQRYANARWFEPESMHSLVEEAHDAHQHPLRDRPTNLVG